jgi:hypothetical protein
VSETPKDVKDPGYVKPGTGQTEKGEDRNEATAPDKSTALDPDSPLVTTESPPSHPGET